MKTDRCNLTHTRSYCIFYLSNSGDWSMAVTKCKFCGMILQNETILARHCKTFHEKTVNEQIS